jgi:hypothetical protein
MVIPSGSCDITGIATRFSSDWQILMRKTSDLKENRKIEELKD